MKLSTLSQSFSIQTEGAVTVDGISLTVASVSGDSFEATLNPHTKAVTTLGIKRIGARVNIEIDLIARYLETLLKNRDE